jgi:hypothetical protein
LALLIDIDLPGDAILNDTPIVIAMNRIAASQEAEWRLCEALQWHADSHVSGFNADQLIERLYAGMTPLASELAFRLIGQPLLDAIQANDVEWLAAIDAFELAGGNEAADDYIAALTVMTSAALSPVSPG